MAIVSATYRHIVLTLAIFNAIYCNQASLALNTIHPLSSRGHASNVLYRTTFLNPQPVIGKNRLQTKNLEYSFPSRALTSLRMAADDFNESKYTEAAWSAIATLTKAADYYEASTIEAPILVDILLNPQKHKAGDDAVAASRIVEKILQSSGANLSEIRSELEKFFAKQPKIGGSAQKMLGRTLQKVLETARESKSLLGVSIYQFSNPCH
jgi:hypothetical protein